VCLAIRENPWCWPYGIANAALFALVFGHARLYGAAALNVLYVLLSVYGWYEWLHGGESHGRLRVTRTPPRAAAFLGVAGVCATASLALFLKLRTDAALPLTDAATTAFSLVAQWMATRKWLENWLVWIVVDVVYVGACLSQRLYPTAGVYAAFLVMAAFGYREWRLSAASARSEAAA
jgi:nicotinamide mononucleotide transporter